MNHKWLSVVAPNPGWAGERATAHGVIDCTVSQGAEAQTLQLNEARTGWLASLAPTGVGGNVGRLGSSAPIYGSR